MDVSVYELKREAPVRPQKPLMHSWVSAAECQVFADAAKRYVEEKAVYDAIVKNQQAIQRAMHIQFKADALEEVGLQHHKNADKLFNYAWDQSHSEGLYSVFNTLENLADLVL